MTGKITIQWRDYAFSIAFPDNEPGTVTAHGAAVALARAADAAIQQLDRERLALAPKPSPVLVGAAPAAAAQSTTKDTSEPAAPAPAPAERNDGAPPRLPPAPPHLATPPGDHPFLPATDAQVRAVYAIALGSLGLASEQVDHDCQAKYANRLPRQLSRREASELIDSMKTKPGKP